VSINPDMTATGFFEELRFETSEEFDKRLEAQDIADAIENILQMRKGVAITELTIRPQKFGIEKKR
jgi:NADP-dependent 3-hydroxy acid dehydrogenase YdfG